MSPEDMLLILQMQKTKEIIEFLKSKFPPKDILASVPFLVGWTMLTLERGGLNPQAMLKLIEDIAETSYRMFKAESVAVN